MDEEMKQKLIELCVDIYAHNEVGWGVTLGGNRVSASEASNVADEILSILGVDQKSLIIPIAKRFDEISGVEKDDDEVERKKRREKLDDDEFDREYK